LQEFCKKNCSRKISLRVGASYSNVARTRDGRMPVPRPRNKKKNRAAGATREELRATLRKKSRSRSYARR